VTIAATPLARENIEMERLPSRCASTDAALRCFHCGNVIAA